MADTYTYTARSAEDPERVVTFTLRDSRLSVEVGAPLEQVERVIEAGRDRLKGDEERSEEETEAEMREAETVEGEPPTVWLRPLTVSVVERGTGPVHVDDVVVRLSENWLQVKAWVRAGGLRLLPITLMDERIDNPVAAADFVEEVEKRKTVTGFRLLGLLDYWATWLTAALVGLVLLQRSRNKGSESDEA